MKLDKPPNTYQNQAAVLLEKGLDSDRHELEKILSSINYYRFTSYLVPFRKKKANKFITGTTLESVLNLYKFDSALRGLVSEALGEIEIATRSRLSYIFTRKYGEAGYEKYHNFQRLKKGEHKQFLKIIDRKTKSSEEEFVKSFKQQRQGKLPFWLVIELMDMGNVTWLYKNVKPKIRKEVASHFNLPSSNNLKHDVLYSWLEVLRVARNQCAHHSRFWNRGLIRAPLTPNKPIWRLDDMPNRNFSGFILFMCRYLLKQISPPSDWHIRVEKLFNDYPTIPIAEMGLSDNWQNHPVWKD